MKKLLAVLMVFAMLLALSACGGKADNNKVYTVGICQQLEHAALDAATEGFKRALTEKLGDKVVFDTRNAQNDPNLCSTIANAFVAKKVDLIMANATNALQAAASATTTIPVLGTSITEYGVALELDNFDGTVGGNVSGTSDLAPLDKQAEMLVEIFPDAKNVGLLYCSAEPNSKYQVNEVKKNLEAKGINCKEFSFSESNEVAAVTTSACDFSDVIYIPTDNTAAGATATIDGICRPAKVPVIAGEEGICKGCGVATLSISYDQLGYTTGLMAAKILTEGADISKMPIEYDNNYKSKYNKEICEDLGISIPDGYEAIAG